MIKPVHTCVSAFITVFKRPWYILLAGLITLTLLLLAIWIPNIPFVSHVIESNIYALQAKAGILVASLGFFKTNFTVLTQSVTITVAVLTGINVAMVVYYLKRRIELEKSVGTGAMGTIVGVLGIGCASCGSVILSSIFGLSATASVLGVLPFKGAEFGLLGIVILVVAIYLVSKKIQNPLVCNIK